MTVLSHQRKKNHETYNEPFRESWKYIFSRFSVCCMVKGEKKEARNEGAMKLDPLSNWDFSRRRTMLSTSLSSLFCPVIFQFLSSAGASENRGKTRRQTLSPLSPEKEDISHRKQRTVWLHPSKTHFPNKCTVYAQLDKKTYECGKVGVTPLLFRDIFSGNV